MSRRSEGRRLYEGLFLFDTADTGKGEALTKLVTEFLAKYGADIVRIDPWGDRKLAYEINGLKRGNYLLIYFKSEPGKIPELERDLRLNEQVLRHMIIYHEKEPAVLRAREEETTTTPAESTPAPAAPATPAAS